MQGKRVEIWKNFSERKNLGIHGISWVFAGEFKKGANKHMRRWFKVCGLSAFSLGYPRKI
jgi:hypothetical protein